MTGKLIVGVDVGGTFTDLFFLDEASGRSWIGKVPSTRGREADGLEGRDGLASRPCFVVHEGFLPVGFDEPALPRSA